MCTSATLRGNALHALSTRNVQDKLWEFMEVRPEYRDNTCSTYASSQHRRLFSATIASLLTATAITHDGKPTLSNALVVALINKQRELNFEGRPCLHHAPPTDRSQVSLFQQACTPYTGQHLQDWRKRLNSELESQNHHQRDTVLRSVAHICQDLETRCATVEEPLRREQAKTQRLEQKISELSKQVSVLQSQVSDDELHLQGLDDEKELLEQEKREMHSENKQLTMRLETLQAELGEAHETVKKTAMEVRETNAAQELVLQTITLEREEENRVHTARLHELNSTISHMEELRAEKGESYCALKEQYTQLQHRLSDSERLVQDERAAIFKLTQELTQLQTQSFDMESQLRGTEEELELTVSKLNNLQVSHQGLQKSSEETLQKARIEHRTDMEAAAARALGERNDLRAQLQTMQQGIHRLQEDHEETRQENQLLQFSVASLETRIQELTDFCSEQGEELDELRTLRRNVLASMGMGTQNPLAIRSVSRSQERNIGPQTPRRLQHRQKPIALPTQNAASKATLSTHSITVTAVDTRDDVPSTLSEAHTAQDGDRNPKRPKPRPSFKPPTTQTPFLQKPILAFTSVSKRSSPSKRSALRQMSPNRRHTTVGFIAAAKPEDQDGQYHAVRARRGSLEELEQVDFDMEDEFEAGTPLTPGQFLAGTGRVPEEDETTTEL